MENIFPFYYVVRKKKPKSGIRIKGLSETLFGLTNFVRIGIFLIANECCCLVSQYTKYFNYKIVNQWIKSKAIKAANVDNNAEIEILDVHSNFI